MIKRSLLVSEVKNGTFSFPSGRTVTTLLEQGIEVGWQGVSHLHTILRHFSSSLLFSPHSRFGFSLCMFYENALEPFFFWGLRLPGDCLSTSVCPFSPREREVAGCVPSRRPVFFPKGGPCPWGSIRRDVNMLLTRSPPFFLWCHKKVNLKSTRQ